MFAAQFVGNANVLPVEVLERDADGVLLRLGGHTRRIESEVGSPGPAWLVLRPEAVRVDPTGAANGVPEALRGVVRDVAYRGTGFSYRIELPEVDALVKAESRGGNACNVEEHVTIDWDADACWLLPREESETVVTPLTAEEDLEPSSPPAAATENRDETTG